jgi:hypothetical protein
MGLEPTEKSPEMTNFLEGLTGRTSAIKALRCIAPPMGCGRDIPPGEMEGWDAQSVQEYRISGMCLDPCQNSVFNSDEEDDEEPECTCDDPCHSVDVGVGIDVTCGSEHCVVHSALATGSLTEAEALAEKMANEKHPGPVMEVIDLRGNPFAHGTCNHEKGEH